MDKMKNLIIIKVINIIVRTFFMAVPKRRQSNAQSGMRSATWKRKALDAARNALSLGKSLTTRKSKGFITHPLQYQRTGTMRQKDLDQILMLQNNLFVE